MAASPRERLLQAIHEECTVRCVSGSWKASQKCAAPAWREGRAHRIERLRHRRRSPLTLTWRFQLPAAMSRAARAISRTGRPVRRRRRPPRQRQHEHDAGGGGRLPPEGGEKVLGGLPVLEQNEAGQASAIKPAGIGNVPRRSACFQAAAGFRHTTRSDGPPL